MADLVLRSSNLDNIVAGPLTARWNAAGTRILRYYIDVRHSKMNLHRELSAPERFILQSKVDALLAAWDEKWEQHQIKALLQSGKESADEMTADALQRLDSLGRILAHTLSINDAVDWEALKDRSAYPMPLRFPQAKPVFTPFPAPAFTAPTISFWNRLIGKTERISEEAAGKHREAVAAWEAQESLGRSRHAAEVGHWHKAEKDFWDEHEVANNAFLAEQAEANAKVDALRMSVSAGDPEAVVEHASLVLEASDYDGRDVAQTLDEGTNLASMSWEDLEHLVRELFEEEFRSRGGEVKVTRSSSDGGVDAVAFDPDPISGGKIVIQAKRYTRTVGVAAVRDLYGTVMNEGASKGILVTTADYGPDAYQFANGKPLTLLNGANLLHLMDKHGRRARIDIREARQAAS